MYLLEPLSAKPIASLCESSAQQQPAFSASLQYTPRHNFVESQIAPRTQKARIDPLPSGAAQLYIISATDCLSVSGPLES